MGQGHAQFAGTDELQTDWQGWGLMALFGAVVLARRQMEMAEDERRAAAGLPRIGDEDALRRGGAA